MSHGTPGLVSNGTPQIAVIIPCHNEAVAIGKVIKDFRAALPDATIFAYDNCSIDDTSRVAREHGAVVRFEGQKGKGNVKPTSTSWWTATTRTTRRPPRP